MAKRNWRTITSEYLIKASNSALGDPVDMLDRKERARRAGIVVMIGKILSTITKFSQEDLLDKLGKQEKLKLKKHEK